MWQMDADAHKPIHKYQQNTNLLIHEHYPCIEFSIFGSFCFVIAVYITNILNLHWLTSVSTGSPERPDCSESLISLLNIFKLKSSSSIVGIKQVCSEINVNQTAPKYNDLQLFQFYSSQTP